MDIKNPLILERRTNNLTISEFFENHQLNKYDYEPDYQRKGNVWSGEKQAFLIDSLFKNYPIPPIFLHAEVDSATGKTIYHVIDGKQRLNSIVKFINDKIHLPENFGDDKYGDESLNGLKFSEISSESPFKRNFWKYSIPIEYVDTEDKDIVNRIFDRLNRNGEPLNYQELRNAKYSNSVFMKTVKELTQLDFWSTRLSNVVEATRMEDDEFISELLFTIYEGTIDAGPKTLDSFYDVWVERFERNPDSIEDLKQVFYTTTAFLDNLNIDYEHYKISGVSHLYGLWGFSLVCIADGVDAVAIRDKVKQFFELLRFSKTETEEIKLYKNSMSYTTKSKNQRQKRIDALVKFCK